MIYGSAEVLALVSLLSGSHFSQSKEAEVGGNLPKVGGKPLHVLLLF